MTNRLPSDVALRVKAVIFLAADDNKYMSMSRNESGRFMDGLVKRKDIGGVLESYIPKQEIRHYIKDGVLNRYTKDKARDAYNCETEDIIEKIFNFKVIESAKQDGAALYRSQQNTHDGKFIVVATGTYLKWETALRKALCFTASSPFSKTANSVETLLILYAQGKIVPPADKEFLSNALKFYKTRIYILGEY